MMMMKMMSVWITLLFMTYVISIHATSSSIGFGVHKLKQFHSKDGYYVTNHSKDDLLGEATLSCPTEVEEYRFKQAVIDNFAPIQDQKYWEGDGQRYWLNKQFWGGKGFPIFVYIGGEGSESCNRLTSRMFVYTLAQTNQGLLVDVEHRFYGDSYPTKDMSTSNLKYLSSHQALADLSRIIGYLKSTLQTQSSKVITLGGSYPGSLAAWFRLKYPSVTDGSIASSAPVIAETNFYGYMDVVAQSLIYFSGQSCYNAFELAANKVSELLKTTDGIKQLGLDFKTCAPMNNTRDISILLSDLMGNVQGTIQYNNEHSGVMNANDVCNIMLKSDDAYGNFVELQSSYLAANGFTCEDASWDHTVAYLSDTTKSASNNARPWTYQTCNEFGYFQTTDSKNQPFHSWYLLDLDFYRKLCFEAFDGWSRDPEVDWINQENGDIRIAGTNILFPSGTIDPWHALGVTNYTKTSLPFKSEIPIYIEGTAHCADMSAPSVNDPSSLIYARQEIADYVYKLLQS